MAPTYLGQSMKARFSLKVRRYILMRREHTTCCKFGTHWGRVLAEKRVKRARAADSLGWCCGVLWAEGAEGGTSSIHSTLYSMAPMRLVRSLSLLFARQRHGSVSLL